MASTLNTASINGSTTDVYWGLIVPNTCITQLNNTPISALKAIPTPTPAYTQGLSRDCLAFFNKAKTIPTTKAASTPSRSVITKVGKAVLKSISCPFSFVICHW